MRTRWLIAVGIVALIGTSCTGRVDPPAAPSIAPAATTGEDGIGLAMSEAERASAVIGDAQAAADSIAAFGIDVYHLLREDADNLVFSPTSIGIALGMARAGARGQTAAEMDAVLRDVATDGHANWLNSLELALDNRSGTFTDAGGQDADVELRVVNAAFVQAGLTLRQAYLDALATRFGTGVRLVDFIRDREAARLRINEWVAEETDDRIPELIAPGILTPLTRLALVDAIRLKAQWHAPFDPGDTTQRPFTTAEGRTVDVPTMAVDAFMHHSEGPGWRAVELPYAGEELGMTIIVPDDLDEFESRLDGELLASVVGSLQEQRVGLTLPRFSIETSAILNDVLKALGMPTAFDIDRADFTGISPEFEETGRNAYVENVVHQANIDVDEFGTEAAAATAVIIGEESGPLVFEVDRPFLFAVRDTQTGAILFLGRIMDPSIDS